MVLRKVASKHTDEDVKISENVQRHPNRRNGVGQKRNNGEGEVDEDLRREEDMFPMSAMFSAPSWAKRHNNDEVVRAGLIVRPKSRGCFMATDRTKLVSRM